MFGDPTKKTLLISNGYNATVLQQNNSFKLLAANFRVIAMKNLSNGANTKLSNCSGLDDAALAR